MCGIGGVYDTDGVQEDDVHKILAMARRSVERGRDATGFMIPNGWWKIAQPSPRAVESSGLADWLESTGVWDGQYKWLMFHTRAMTRGSPRVSANNHPMVHGRDEYGVKLIHNGNVRDPDYYGLDVVDTRSLAYLLNRLRKNGMSLVEATRTALVSIYGRAAIAVSDRYGEEFVVMKDANEGRSPLFYYWNKRDDRMQFSSTKKIAGDSMIGNVGKKHGNVTEYEMKHWQALWWSGIEGDRLKRIWHLEKHGGEDLLERVPLPSKINTELMAPKDFDDGGKFSLNYRRSSNYPSKKVKVRRKNKHQKPWNDRGNYPTRVEKQEVTEYIPISKHYKEDSVVSNIVMYPVVVPVIEDEEYFTEVDWFRFQDHLWAKSMRAELIKLQEQGLFVNVMRYDESSHTMYILLNGNMTRKYFRSIKKKKLVYIDLKDVDIW